mmetsp:Transcript_4279/g.4956  ORF Transcript_4279/g.4956 Transcript_4279/m.4956 type:complete len:241 (-) Transcript_4279:92-814(-)
MKFTSSTLFVLACALTSTFAAVDDECKKVAVQQDFDYDTYASKPWYVQSQMVTDIAPPSDFFCVRGRFRLLDEPLNGYPIGVLVENRVDNVTGVRIINDLCSFSDPSDPAKLVLSICNVPREVAGDYWIVRYNEEEGYMIIAGGQPTIPSGRGDGLCKTGTGFTQSGLYIFTREQKRDEELVKKVMKVAEEAGYDSSVLKFVDQEGCDYADDPEPNPKEAKSGKKAKSAKKAKSGKKIKL